MYQHRNTRTMESHYSLQLEDYNMILKDDTISDEMKKSYKRVFNDPIFRDIIQKDSDYDGEPLSYDQLHRGKLNKPERVI